MLWWILRSIGGDYLRSHLPSDIYINPHKRGRKENTGKLKVTGVFDISTLMYKTKDHPT